MNRFKNYAFWISLTSAVLLVLTSVGVQVDNAYFMTIAKAILGVLVILGIINNPTTPGYSG